VDGKSVQGKPTGESSALLQGVPQTEVEVEIKRYGESSNLKFKLIREKIKITNVTYQGLIEKDLGYIKLDEFYAGCQSRGGGCCQQNESPGSHKAHSRFNGTIPAARCMRR